MLVNQQPDAITVQLALWPVDGNDLPTGAPLATQTTILPGGSSGDVWVEALIAPVTVAAGARYALLARVTAGMFMSLAVQQGDGYPGGQAVIRFDSGVAVPASPAGLDAAFRVYVDPFAPRYTLSATAAPNPVVLPQPVTYTFTAGNTGTAAGASTLLTVTLPAGTRQQGAMTVLSGGLPVPGAACTVRNASQISCALGSLAIGATYTIAIPARIASGTLGAQYCARGVISGGTAGATGMATAQACTGATVPPGDLAMTLSCPGTVASGTDLASVCTATVRNIGPSPVLVRAGQTILRADFDMTGGQVTGLGLVQKPAGYFVSEGISFGGANVNGWVSYSAQNDDVIAPGATRTFSVTMANHTNGPASHTASVAVDPFGVIPEGNEGNNTAGPAITTIQGPG